ncbi:MAG: helix-turn-helix transcriptional regulator [Pseudonocardia sp.]|nr:helix-turn-helix transcriptional regulator [Pseudonocardia sp.]
MATELDPAALLAQRLRQLRTAHWPETRLTQATLAHAFGVEAATISAWESATSGKTPSPRRLEAYARFFASRRSLDESHPLVPEADLSPDEQHQYRKLHDELLGLQNGPAGMRAGSDTGSESERAEVHGTAHLRPRGIFTFAEGPVTVICPKAPESAQGPLASQDDPNFAKLQQYGDLDALIELYGHLRASNPVLDVFHLLASEVTADDMSTHSILLGGVGWNRVTRRFLEALRQVPITQFLVDEYPGDIFEVTEPARKRFLPVWEDGGGGKVLLEDVALLARIPNPFNVKRTLTICNGVHSRGVLGAVRCLTDKRVRDANEEFLAERFPDGRFALLLRAPVVENETLSPDLQNAAARLYEWPFAEGR